MVGASLEGMEQKQGLVITLDTGLIQVKRFDNLIDRFHTFYAANHNDLPLLFTSILLSARRLAKSALFE